MTFVAKHIGLKPLANKVMKLFFGPAFLTDPERKEIRKIWKDHFTANNQSGIVKAVKGVLFREAMTDRINGIEHPTTIMVGAEDQLTDLTRAEILHAQIPNTVLEVIPRAGHMSPVEEPDLVNSIIKDHLARVSSQ